MEPARIWISDADCRLEDFRRLVERHARLADYPMASAVHHNVLTYEGDDIRKAAVKPESHRSDVAIVFCDLRGFTALAETAEPEEVMAILREYHAALGDIIHRFEGTLERFLGDGLMVIFNDPVPCPDPAERAIRMALAMRDRVIAMAEQWKKRGHELGFGIGIAQGYATLGRIGFEGRFDYAAIGTVPNLASRICAEAKSGQILISQRVLGAIEHIADVEPLGAISLKGLARPIPIHDVRGLKDCTAAPVTGFDEIDQGHLPICRAKKPDR